MEIKTLSKPIKIFAVFIAVISLLFALLKFSFNRKEHTTEVSNHTPVDGYLSQSQTKPTEKKLQISRKDSDSTIVIAGEVIAVEFKYLELNRFVLPDKSAKYLYSKLKDRALSGDSIAARMLASMIIACNEAHSDEKLHNAAMSRLTESNKYPSADPRFSDIEVSNQDIKQVESYFNNQYEKCIGLTKAQRGEASYWSRIAVDGGDFLAIEQLIGQQDISDFERLSLLEKQWTDYGYIESALSLTAVLSDLGRHTGFEKIKVNNSKAYSYFLAGTILKLKKAEQDGLSDYELTKMKVSFGEFENLLTSKLSSQDHIDAEQAAINLIKSNSNCCTLDPPLNPAIPNSE